MRKGSPGAFASSTKKITGPGRLRRPPWTDGSKPKESAARRSNCLDRIAQQSECCEAMQNKKATTNRLKQYMDAFGNMRANRHQDPIVARKPLVDLVAYVTRKEIK
jgi:hypothetical protein